MRRKPRNYPLLKLSSFGRPGARLESLEENKQSQKEGDDHQPKGDESPRISIEDIGFVSHNPLRIKATNKQTIAPNRSAVKTNNLFLPFSWEKLGTIRTVPNQPADKLTNKSERIKEKVESNFIDYNLLISIQDRASVVTILDRKTFGSAIFIIHR